MANYIPITTITVGSGGVASVTFLSIPATYTDLVIKASVRTNNNAVFDNPQVRFNGDSGNNYSRLFVASEGAVINNFTATANNAYFPSYSFNAANATANTFSNAEFYISNYASANKKSISVDAVSENNATTGYDGLHAGSWSGTAAINSINIAPSSGTLLLQYSTFTLYGIRKY